MLFVHMRCSNAFCRHSHEGHVDKHKTLLERPNTGSCLSADFLPANHVVLLGLPCERSLRMEVWLLRGPNVPLTVRWACRVQPIVVVVGREVRLE